MQTLRCVSLTACWYVSFGEELQTSDAIAECLAVDGPGRVVVPFCVGDTLGLWGLRTFEELEPGTWGILEPSRAVRHEHCEQLVSPGTLDLIVVPGLAFDRSGGRLGYGKGYYDRLLAEARPDALRVGLCFDCQLIDEVPSAAHDQRMDYLVTETGVVACIPATGEVR